jgi:DNA primase
MFAPVYMPADATSPPADLVRIVSKLVLLRDSRKVLRGNCPFHPDQSASFMVYPARNIFKCFGCGREGGPKEFLLAMENNGDGALR